MLQKDCLNIDMRLSNVVFQFVHSVDVVHCIWVMDDKIVLLTGADVLIASSIKVRFVEPLSDFSRTPVAHTCGYVLEFPNSYGSYLELAEELTELLDSKVWVMDIV